MSDAAPPLRGKLLVIDDDVLVGTSIRRLLSVEHEVTVVTHGQAALDKLAAGERFDLVLCDLMMPDLTGMDVFEAIERDHPALAARIIFVTGGAVTPKAREFLERPETRRVDKPFSGPALKQLVRDELASLGAYAGP